MNIIVDLALPLVAGICLFGGLTHLLIWLHRRNERVALASDPQIGPLYYVFILSCWAVYAFAFHLCYRRWRLGERVESLLLASSVVLFLGGSVVDTLRELGLVPLYVSEFCFVAFVVTMSVGLSRRLRRDAQEQERLNEGLRRSEESYRNLVENMNDLVHRLELVPQRRFL